MVGHIRQLIEKGFAYEVEDAEKEGKDILAEMVIAIEYRIVGAKSRLNTLNKNDG